MADNLLIWASEHLLSLRALHIQGLENKVTGPMSRGGLWQTNGCCTQRWCIRFRTGLGEQKWTSSQNNTHCPFQFSLTPQDDPHLHHGQGGLAPESDRAGLSAQVVQTIQAARAGSTIASYKVEWLGYQRWCEERRLDPLTCAVGEILSFLQHLVEKGLSHSTVKVYAAAVSSCHEGFGDRPVFPHPLVKRFLQGIRRQWPGTVSA